MDKLCGVNSQYRFRQSSGKPEPILERMAHNALINRNQIIECLRVLSAFGHFEDELWSGLHAIPETGENAFECSFCHFRRILFRNTVVEEGSDLLQCVLSSLFIDDILFNDDSNFMVGSLAEDPPCSLPL